MELIRAGDVVSLAGINSWAGRETGWLRPRRGAIRGGEGPARQRSAGQGCSPA